MTDNAQPDYLKLRPVAILFIITLAFGPIITSGFLMAFIDIASLLLVVGGTFGVLLFCYEKRLLKFILACVQVTFGKELKSQEFAEIAIMGRYCALVSGIVCTLVRLIIMLVDLSDPSKIGVGMAVALLGFFYAFVLAYFIFMPLEATFLENPLDRESICSPPHLTFMCGVVCQIFVVLLGFFVLLNVLADKR